MSNKWGVQRCLVSDQKHDTDERMCSVWTKKILLFIIIIIVCKLPENCCPNCQTQFSVGSLDVTPMMTCEPVSQLK